MGISHLLKNLHGQQSDEEKWPGKSSTAYKVKLFLVPNYPQFEGRGKPSTGLLDLEGVRWG